MIRIFLSATAAAVVILAADIVGLDRLQAVRTISDGWMLAIKAAGAVSGVLISIFDPTNFRSVYFYLYLMLIIGVGSHLSPSWPDIRGALLGGIFAFLFLLMVNAVYHGVSQDLDDNIRWYYLILNVILQALAVNLCLFLLISTATLIIILIGSVKSRLANRH